MKLKGLISTPADTWIVNPLRSFFNNSTMGGIVLFSSALIALILSNSSWAQDFHHLWQIKFSIGLGDYVLSKDLHHWINDGLMAIFFFVVGLELKREFIAGELSNPRNAILPIVAAIVCMVIPASIYVFLNPTGAALGGWGIPMATDIAFALGILYIIGDKVPVSLKVFLTALAIVDDIGAVLVIAFFYTSNINMISLATGALFLVLLILANRFGVRHTGVYAILGIGGLWLAFLMSGVHATIAGVLAAFTIPATVKVPSSFFSKNMSRLVAKFDKASNDDERHIVTPEQLHILEEVQELSTYSLSPLQKLEHALHPMVAFLVMPIFALSNAGVTMGENALSEFMSPVALGVFFGLIFGKVLGLQLVVIVLRKLNISDLPKGMNTLHVWGAGFLAAIGFTMSLFIANLAFTNPSIVDQAKMGILGASFVASIVGYILITMANNIEEAKKLS